jgi:hypothetical protein
LLENLTFPISVNGVAERKCEAFRIEVSKCKTRRTLIFVKINSEGLKAGEPFDRPFDRHRANSIKKAYEINT